MRVWRRIYALLIAVALLSAAPQVDAQKRSPLLWLVDVGIARSDSVTGLGLAVGFGIQWHRLRATGIGELVFYPSSDDRYSRDTFSNGQSRCRDSQTGQFASDSKCAGVGATGGAIGALELSPLRRFPLIVGGGYRLADKAGPVGILGYSGPFSRFGATWRVTAIVGELYWSMRWGLAIPG